MTTVCSCYNVLRWLNKKRREATRKLTVSFAMRDGHAKRTLPGKLHSVLLVTTSRGIGDSLYVMGLAKLLRERGVHMYIAALNEHCALYERSKLFEDVYELGVDDCPNLPFSAVVDLEYVNVNHWRLRRDFLKGSNGCRITTSPFCRTLSFYDDFVDYALVAHISERLALVAQKLLRDSSIERIMPHVVTDEASEAEAETFLRELPEEKPIVYLNTRAGDDDRWFGKIQTASLLSHIGNRYDVTTVLLPPDDDPCYFKYPGVVRLKSMSFSGFCSFLRRVQFVATPDTSVTHVAAAFDIPCLTVFPPNDRDYFKEYGAWEAWGALSSISTTLHPDASDLAVDRFGFANRLPKPALTIPSHEIINAFDKLADRSGVLPIKVSDETGPLS